MRNHLSENILTGLIFAVLWSSASVAAKFGLRSVEPLVLFNIRFLLAGGVLIVYSHFFQKHRLPRKNEWKQITIFGTFNTALYLGIFILALQFLTAGVTTLSIALNPLFISVMTAAWTKRRITLREWLSIAMGIAGVGIASYPLLQSSQVSLTGLMLLALSMGTYSFGAVYYSSVPWQLPRMVVNAWQVLIGGILVIPLTWLLHKVPNEFDFSFWLSLAWLIFPVSILAVQLWLRMLKTDAVRASLWLYLCPLFGFGYSSLLLGEPLTWFTGAGTILVLAAVFLGQTRTQS